MPQRLFITDCEGPISRNDNAYELAEHYIPDGGNFFRLLSRYDDVLADLVRRPNYSAGYTLKLIAPFLKAYGATNGGVIEYSSHNLLLIRDTKEALQQIQSFLPSYIVSTSYSQYIKALCALLEFPEARTCSTRLDLDKYDLSSGEAERLQMIRRRITGLSSIEIPDGARSLDDLSPEARTTVAQLDTIFWEELPGTVAGRILESVQPVGGAEKAEAIREIAGFLDVPLGEVMYVGDSITDVEAFRSVRASGGLTVSFNGNSYAVRDAEIGVLSDTAFVTLVLARIFADRGRVGVLEVAEKWPEELSEVVESQMSEYLFAAHLSAFPRVVVIKPDNLETTVKESTFFRKTVRGEMMGRLG